MLHHNHHQFPDSSYLSHPLFTVIGSLHGCDFNEDSVSPLSVFVFSGANSNAELISDQSNILRTRVLTLGIRFCLTYEENCGETCKVFSHYHSKRQMYTRCTTLSDWLNYTMLEAMEWISKAQPNSPNTIK
ncbi:putative trehalose-phosphate phosphatase J [Senna tora]|uniref:Putative trehalose-phosphate phosphatase J n=1 Tax=Senna tora TaxID=362788 RepID=A0A834SR84_9FABA|nr:putative trehalose-phosphate phosphatase J [Senna tora]